MQGRQVRKRKSVRFSGGPRAARARTTEFCRRDGRRGLGGVHEQEEKEADEGYDSGEGETEQPVQVGWGDDSKLPQGRRDRSNDPNLPNGWRPKPANLAAGAKNPPPVSRRRSVRRIRRGGGGAGEATTSLTILNNYVCGYNCKKASIPSIMEKLEPDVCTWQETGLTGNNQMKIKGYHASVRNRKNFKKMGGVATAVKTV